MVHMEICMRLRLAVLYTIYMQGGYGEGSNGIEVIHFSF